MDYWKVDDGTLIPTGSVIAAYRTFVTALLKRAYLDAERGNMYARWWLLNDGLRWAEQLSLDAEQFREIIERLPNG